MLSTVPGKNLETATDRGFVEVEPVYTAIRISNEGHPLGGCPPSPAPQNAKQNSQGPQWVENGNAFSCALRAVARSDAPATL